MPVSAGLVGAISEAIRHEVDARWLMAYASALRDLNPLYMDTEANRVVAHPVFPVCLEWAASLSRWQAPTDVEPLTSEESARAVHGTHDLHILKPVQADMKLATQGTVIGLRATRAGAATEYQFDTSDVESGDLVARTYQTGIYRGVDISGEPQSIEVPPSLPEWQLSDASRKTTIAIPEGTAHVYTECARIWNPIHTDRAYALAAGLPDIPLHGTATLAFAISQMVNDYAGGDPRRVTRLGCRFSALVLMPNELTLVSDIDDGVISFQVLNATGEPALRDGFVCLNA